MQRIIPPKITSPSWGQPTSINCSTWLYSNLTTLSQGRATLGTIPAPQLASSRWISWSFIAPTSQFNSFAWLYFPHLPRVLIWRTFPEKSLSLKSLIRIYFFVDMVGAPTPHKTKSHIKSRKLSAARHQNSNSKLFNNYGIYCLHGDSRASLVAQLVKNLPAMWETWVWSLGWEDPLEECMVTLSSILAWRIPRTGEPGWLQSMGSQRVGHDWATFTFTFN